MGVTDNNTTQPMFHLGKIRIHRDQGRVEQNQSFTWILDTFLESFYVLHQFLSNLPEQHLDRPQANLSERETFQRFPDCPYVLLVKVVLRNLHPANLASHSGSNNSFLFTISGNFYEHEFWPVATRAISSEN